jgi:alkylation response protein AidB-like acyl-CoA dehydrogenase
MCNRDRTMSDTADLSADTFSRTLSRLAVLAGDRAPAIDALLRAVAGLLPAMRARARALDRTGAFPAAEIAALRDCGALRAALPLRHGGLGLGTEAEGGAGLFDLLRLTGSGSLSAGRIVEGHVNALQLICLYGDEDQIARAAVDVAAGHLFAIWNTEPPPGVRLCGDRLRGRKVHVSAAGQSTRPLITVDHQKQSRLLLACLAPGDRTGPSPTGLHGMRATCSGWADFEGYAPGPRDWIGEAGDYLREPAFSAGAWRALAVILGGVTALTDELRAQLRARGRDGNPHQAARIADALIAQETAFLWTRKAGLLAEAGTASRADITGYVALARRAVERAALEIMQLAQRSLGLAAFADDNPVELLLRDLATYLRQPALDEAVMEAAAHFVAADLPPVP